jgi:hypothetical protein
LAISEGIGLIDNPETKIPLQDEFCAKREEFSTLLEGSRLSREACFISPEEQAMIESWLDDQRQREAVPSYSPENIDQQGDVYKNKFIEKGLYPNFDTTITISKETREKFLQQLERENKPELFSKLLKFSSHIYDNNEYIDLKKTNFPAKQQEKLQGFNQQAVKAIEDYLEDSNADKLVAALHKLRRSIGRVAERVVAHTNRG